MIVVEDYIKSVVCSMNPKNPTGEEMGVPFFWFGNKEEIERIIASNQKDNTIKTYPCIILETPFTEDIDTYSNVVKVDSMRLLFATKTEQTYRSPERLEEVFKPTLYPILESFNKEMIKSKFILNYDITSKKNVFYYGVESGEPTIQNDKWDYIEIIADIRLRNSCT